MTRDDTGVAILTALKGAARHVRQSVLHSPDFNRRTL
jgi:hypothetical protein